jgi:hypothetical protein
MYARGTKSANFKACSRGGGNWFFDTRMDLFGKLA